MSNLRKDMHASVDPGSPVPAVVTCPSCRTRWRFAGPAADGERCRCSRCGEVFAADPPLRAYAVRATAEPLPRTDARPGAVSVFARIGPSDGRPPRDLRVGLDDPSLAERVERSALTQRDGGRVRAWTWTVVADERDRTRPADGGSREAVVARAPAPDPVAAAAPAVAGPASLRETGSTRTTAPVAPPETPSRASDTIGSFTGTFSFLENFGEEAVPGAAGESPSDPAQVQDGVADERGDGSALARFVGVVVLAAAGAAAGWFGAVPIGNAVAAAASSWPGFANGSVPREASFWAGPGAVAGLVLAWGWVRWNGRSR